MKIDQRFFPENETTTTGFTTALPLSDDVYPVGKPLNDSQIFGVQKGKYACGCYDNIITEANFVSESKGYGYKTSELKTSSRPYTALRFFSKTPTIYVYKTNYATLPVVNYSNYFWSYPQITSKPSTSKSMLPVIAFNHNTLCYLVKIWCCNLNIINTSYTSNPNSQVVSYYLDEYFENYSETYPDILGIQLIPYYPYRKTELPRTANSFLNNGYAYEMIYEWTGEYDYRLIDQIDNVWTNKVENTGACLTYTIRNEMMIGSSEFSPYSSTQLANTQIVNLSMGSPSFVRPIRIEDTTITETTYPDNERPQYIGWKVTATKEEILHMVACYGCYFTGDETTAESGTTTDRKMYLGIFNKDGTLTGEYSQGEENANQTNFNWSGSDPYEFNGYTGNIDPNVYTSEIELNTPEISTIDVFNRSFAMNETQINEFADFLWNADESIFSEIIKGLALLGDNPLNGVIDLRLFPFDIQKKNNATDLIDIKIGRTNTGVQGYRLDSKVSSVIDLGYCTFYPVFGNFLDYSPYTTATLMIPYCGSIIVDTKDFMGHRISCKLIVDYNTGACCACVFKDDIPYTFVNGICAVSIPVSGSNSAQFAQNFIGGIVNGATQIAQGLGEVSAGKTSGTGRMTSGILEIAKPIFNHPTQYQLSGSATPSTAFFQPQNCYFVISRPVTNIPSDYGHTTGFACELTTQLSAMSGFTVCENVDVTIPTTTEEQELIKQLLESGVYL